MKRRNISEVRRCCNGSETMRGRAPLFNFILKEIKKCLKKEKIEPSQLGMLVHAIMACVMQIAAPTNTMVGVPIRVRR